MTSARQSQVARGTRAVRIALQTLILLPLCDAAQTGDKEHSAWLFAQALRATGGLPSMRRPTFGVVVGLEGDEQLPAHGVPAVPPHPRRKGEQVAHTRILRPAGAASAPRMPRGCDLWVLRAWSTGCRTPERHQRSTASAAAQALS